MTYKEDTSIWPIMEDLSNCLCAVLEDRGLLPDKCFCGILPGDITVQEYPNGMSWVRLTSAFQSTAFPAQDMDMSPCGKPLAADIEVGVLHCAPKISAGKVLPTADEQWESARLQVATMDAMRYAITCCMDNDVVDIALGIYTPVGPNGGLVGGTWNVNVGVL